MVKCLTGMQEALHHMDEPAASGLGKWRQKDQKFNITVCYIGSSRPGWAAWDLVLEQANKQANSTKDLQKFFSFC